MADNTKIEWTDATWNPLAGCSRASEGCRFCYAERQAARIIKMDRGRGVEEGQGRYDGLLAPGGQWNGKIKLAPTATLLQPVRWRRGRRVFVNSMSDLFHEAVADEVIDRIFAVMLACQLFGRQHTFQVLTKRADRMQRYFAARTPGQHLKAWAKAGDGVVTLDDPDIFFSEYVENQTCHDWDERGNNRNDSPFEPWGYTDKLFPLPNLWLGVSVENQAAADERLPRLMDSPAAIRWVSAEPLIGAVELSNWLEIGSLESQLGLANPGIDWVVVGGESGPNARPMLPDWARALQVQCEKAAVAFLFKQWGEHHTLAYRMSDQVPVFRQFDSFQQWVNKASTWVNGGICIARDGTLIKDGGDMRRAQEQGLFPVTIMHRVGKRKAGRLLDGILYDSYPKAAATL